MQKNLIIFTHGGGRLANQLTNYAHFLAFWEENKNLFDVIYMAFNPYAKLFERTVHNTLGFLPFGHKRMLVLMKCINVFLVARENNKKTIHNQIIRLFHLLFGILPGIQSLKKGYSPNFLPYLFGEKIQELDLDRPSSLTKLRSKKITLLAGWPIRSWGLFRKHQNAIREYFKVNDIYSKNAISFISDIKINHDVLVGVLMRQDDYRIWNGGKYYFSTDEYVEWMKQVQNLFNGKKIAFVIASDEEQSLTKFNSVAVYLSTGEKLGRSHFIESFAELSLCDYVMTPPSTFGIWAAFLGNIPIIPLYIKNQTISKSQILINHIFDAIEHPHMSFSIQ